MQHGYPSRSPTDDPASVLDGLCRWASSLPWVVELPGGAGTSGAQLLAVDCAPLARRQVWLVTIDRGPHRSTAGALAVVLPARSAAEVDSAGTARRIATLPADHALMQVSRDASLSDIESLVLTAYAYAMT
jgi:hypothetical protein